MRNIRENMTDKSKIWLIYDEFSKYAPEDISETELLKAAHDLLEISKNEYIHPSQIERKDRLSYQNCDLVDAFSKYEQKIFREEYPRLKNDFHENHERRSNRKFKNLNKLSN